MGALSVNQRQDLDHVADGSLVQGTHKRDVHIVCAILLARLERHVLASSCVGASISGPCPI